MIYRLEFGRIEQLPIVNGEPQLDSPGVRVVEEHKFPREPQSRASTIPEAHWSKPQVLEFCELLDQQPNVTLMSLDIRHGTPFRVLLARSAS